MNCCDIKLPEQTNQAIEKRYWRRRYSLNYYLKFSSKFSIKIRVLMS
jgi:hypothetical protein